MLKRVLPWSVVLAVVLVIVQIGVERGPWEAGVSLWRWRFILGGLLIVCGFAAACAWSYDRGVAKGKAEAPAPADNPLQDEIRENRANANHQWTSIDQLQYLVRTISTNVMASGHRNAERAVVELRSLERQHRAWYDAGTHATRDHFIGVVNGILEVRRRNGRHGIFADLNVGEAQGWEARLVSVRQNLLDALEDQKEVR
jgi:hypothetical protein